MTEEMVRDLEQIRHQAETIQRSLPRDQTLSETQTSAVKIVTPIYKSHERTPGSDIQMGGSHAHSERIRSQNGDYTAERSTEQVRMQIIDPRVNSNAHIPSQHGSLPGYGRRTVGDFPSEHGKRSLLNLDPLEQRRIRSIQSRPITTSTYLTESVDRHREMEASKLRNFLKASEDDANKPWNKPAWPGPKGDDDSGESSRQIELIKKKIADLQRAAQEPKKDASSATWQFNSSFSPKSIVSLNGATKNDDGLLKVRTTVTSSEHDDKPRSIMKRSQLESRQQMTYAEPERRIVEVQRSKPKVTETVSRVEEQKRTEEVERRIIRRERRHKSSRHRYGHGHHAEYVDYGSGGGEEREAIAAEARRAAAEAKLMAVEKRGQERESTKYTVTEKTYRHQQREEEETRRRSQYHLQQQRQQQQQSERLDKTAQTSQDDFRDHQGRRQAILRRYDGRRYTADELNQAVKHAYKAVDKAYQDIRQWRSNSMQRHNGYLPANESYHRSTSSRRERDHGAEFGSQRHLESQSGLAHARYGSLSDSLRRGELKYVPNGDFKENYSRNGKMHKSYSTRDVYNDGGRESSYRRGSAGQGSPFIEFPPTLPRSARGEPPSLPPHRGGFAERPLTKSRSYADWDEGRGPFGNNTRSSRYEDDMARLENEFRDSLLMRLPNGNMNDKDYRHEQIPGGHETYSREAKANAGRRLNREGVPTDFKEASQEYSFKREVQH